MKQQDVALLIIVIAVSFGFSMLFGKMIIKPPSDQEAKVEVVEAINVDFPPADPSVFNDSAINPTRPITIGNDQNQNPIQAQ